jgi:hypothetical protein
MLATGLEAEIFSTLADVQFSAIDNFASMHNLFADIDPCLKQLLLIVIH